MSDPYIGQITMFAGNYAPSGWAICDGSALPINGYEALYTLLGTIYGGDGQSTFCLPDLRGRVVVGTGQMQGGTINWALGTRQGTEEVTLTAAQSPAHTHTFNAVSNQATQASPVNAYFGADLATENGFSNAATPASTLAAGCVSLDSGGQGQPHDNMAPFIAINYIIATTGIFPTSN